MSPRVEDPWLVSDLTVHTARRDLQLSGDLWLLSFLPERSVSFKTAVAGLTMAEIVAATGDSAWQPWGLAMIWPLLEQFAAALELDPLDAVIRVLQEDLPSDGGTR